MMEMWSASVRSKRDKKEVIAYIRNELAASIHGDGEMHANLSEKVAQVALSDEDFGTRATGEMTLTLSWKAGDLDKSGVIDEESFSQIAKEIEEEMGYSGLTGTMYEEFALRVAERYIEEVEE